MTVRINKQKINLREKLAGTEEKVSFEEVVRGLGEYTGNVGIGTTDPVNVLHVHGKADGLGYIRITDGSTGSTAADGARIGYNALGLRIQNYENTNISFFTNSSTEALTIKNNGNVGIGTTNPREKLSIVGSIKISNVLSANPVNEDVLGSIGFEGPSSTNTNASAGVRLDAIAEADHSGISAATGLQFYTKSSTIGPGSAPTPAMRIDSDGNVGIGTTTPGTYKLKVEGSLRAERVNSIVSTDGSASECLYLANATTEEPFIRFNAKNSTNGINWSIGVDDETLTDEKNLFAFKRWDDANTLKDTPFVIHSNGKVGIGTTNPLSDFVIRDGTDNTASSFEINCSNNQVLIEVLQRDNGNTPSPLRYVAEKHIFFGSTGGSGGAGNVGIGTTTPGTYKLNVNGTTFCTAGVWGGSDDRIKHNEQNIVGAIETLGKLTPKKYIKTTEMYEANHDFELDADGNPVDADGEPVEHTVEAGVIAQQVLTVDELAFAVSPEGVDEDGNVTSPHGLNYNSLFTYAIAAIQEQQSIIEDLKLRIKTLES